MNKEEYNFLCKKGMMVRRVIHSYPKIVPTPIQKENIVVVDRDEVKTKYSNASPCI